MQLLKVNRPIEKRPLNKIRLNTTQEKCKATSKQDQYNLLQAKTTNIKFDFLKNKNQTRRNWS
ncbi:hypothetical protein PSCICF_03120 [Pseudomonas cichorii]|nr:hypothetical protein PSCICF_03120 [Pseudomonas cichorii]